MKTFKVSTSAGAYYVNGVGCGWIACQVAQQELGDGVEIYDAIEIEPYEDNDALLEDLRMEQKETM